MTTLRLPETIGWTNITSVSTIPNSRSVVIRNYGAKTVYVSTSSVEPLLLYAGYPLLSNETICVEPTGKDIWVYGEDGLLWIEDQVASGISQFVSTDISGFSTANAEQTPRIKTETSTAAFFEGRQYRTFKELNITAGGVYTIKIDLTKDIVLRELHLQISSGHCKLNTISGGTDSTPFSSVVPIIRKNTMSSCPVIDSSSSLREGGTQTGGVLLDVIDVQSSGWQNFRSTVGNAPYDERGVGPGIYYWKFSSVSGGGDVKGVFRCFWEESK